MDKRNHIIKVEKNSIAEELGIEIGDVLLEIDGNKIEDVFDYRYLIQNEYIEVSVEKQNGEQWLLEIEKEEYEDLGIDFESGLMDNAKSCKNKCIFCFIDQLPEGMRESMYFKDDDTRLSFLQGNYCTFTNMKDKDIDRIIFYHLSPINISVHTTNMPLRKEMLKNPNAVKLMGILDKLYENHIQMNFQIVLCKGYNDGKELDKSIIDLGKYIPVAKSMSVVPIGLTRYRDGLCQIDAFDKEDCVEIIKQVEEHQNRFLEQYGTRFVFLSDEFYLKAELPIPDTDYYEDFPQLENGVGMLSLFEEEFNEYYNSIETDEKHREVSIATGYASYDLINKLAVNLQCKLKNTKINVYSVKNNFFGEKITVSGLMTGQDIINQLQGKSLGSCLFIPENSLKADEPVFLDDVSLEKMERELNIKIRISETNGSSFIKQIMEE